MLNFSYYYHTDDQLLFKIEMCYNIIMYLLWLFIYYDHTFEW